MALKLLSITADQLLTFTNSIISWQPNGRRMLSAQKEYATASEEDLIELMRQEPGLLRDWDEKYGDRMIKLVFIGQHLDKKALTKALDECLE